MAHKFLVHDRGDSVGVAVVDIQSGETVDGVVLADDSPISVTATQPVPLGHKIALVAVEAGGTLVKYGEAIGKAVAPIQRGQHVHTHNVRSARW